MTTDTLADFEGAIDRRDDGVYVVTAYGPAAALLRDPRLRPSTTGVIDRLTPVWREHPSLRMLADMVLLDVPPRHGSVRAALHEQFSPAGVAELGEQIDAQTTRLIDEVAAADEPVDVTARVARALPLTVIGELLGIDDADRIRIARLTRVVMDTMWYNVVDIRRADASGLLLSRYFRERVRLARSGGAAPDLMQALVEAPELDDDAVVANLVFLVMAATFTTGDFIGSALVRSFHEPELRRHLSRGIEVDAAIEEALRLDPPVARVLRNTAAALDVGGLRIPEGSLIEFDLRAANRDPRQFDEPEAFRLGRHEGRSLSFGYGVHYCAGWALGKAEATSVLTAFWRRFPNARLAAEPEREEHVFLNGFGRILVDPGDRDGSGAAGPASVPRIHDRASPATRPATSDPRSLRD